MMFLLKSFIPAKSAGGSMRRVPDPAASLQKGSPTPGQKDEPT